MRFAPPLALMLALGCAGSRPPAAIEPAPGGAEPVTATRAEPAPAGPTIAESRRAIARALSAAPEWEDLRLFTECRRDAGLEAIEIHGNGVAIWHGKRQFELPAERIRAILVALRESGFAAMPASYGGKGGTAPPPLPGEASDAFVTTVLCRVRFSYAGVDKEVVQLEKGEQSAALRELSEVFFRECEAPARIGVEAEDLADGLEKVALGELAPETLALMLHYRPDSDRGFRLRILGREATTRAIQPGSGLQEPISGRLGTPDVENLARDLAIETPQTLPPNLWAEHYTDFSLAVLNHEVSIQARQFAGLEPATHGEAQLRFESIIERLTELEARIGAAVPSE